MDDERSSGGPDDGPEIDGQRRSWRLSRRDFLGMTAAGGAAVAASGLFAGPAEAATPQHWPCGPRGTTLEHTLLPGTPGAGGYAPLVVRPGEPHLLRDELVGGLRHRHGRRRPITVLGQLTDVHIMDAQSPARVEYLDRYNDPDSPFASVLPFDSSYRAHEMLSAQVSDSMVRAMNRVGRGPVTGRRIDFTIATGDNVDNTQHNELRWQIDLLDGETIRPDSGDLTKYEGVADLTDYDVHYWHPDGAPSGQPADRPHANWGFPSVPGLLDACRKPFRAAGLRTPWLTTFGNHDGLVQGNLPDIPQASQLAVGPVKFIDLPPNTDIIQLAIGLQHLDPAALQTLFSGPFRFVTPDPDRRPLSRLETIQEHFNTSGFPKGHGYTQANVSSGNAYYAFDRGLVRGLVLDTVNPFGGSEGSLDETQLAWLTTQLQAGSRRYLDESGHWVRGGHRDRLFVIFSHHTIETMTNASAPPGVTRILGAQMAQLLLRFPNVVLWVNGHTHRNTVVPYARAAGMPGGGFWEVNTAAHIDWPQQARIVEIVDNDNGTLSIFGTIIDHAAPVKPGKTLDVATLASLSRVLASNDWQRPVPTATVDGRRGAVEDRNVELLVPAPFDLD
jgi:metallophosphoesterase (TIGR03767 family)